MLLQTEKSDMNDGLGKRDYKGFIIIIIIIIICWVR